MCISVWCCLGEPWPLYGREIKTKIVITFLMIHIDFSSVCYSIIDCDHLIKDWYRVSLKTKTSSQFCHPFKTMSVVHALRLICSCFQMRSGWTPKTCAGWELGGSASWWPPASSSSPRCLTSSSPETCPKRWDESGRKGLKNDWLQVYVCPVRGDGFNVSPSS